MTSAPLIRNGYTDCRLGQLHYLEGVPTGATTATPLVLLHQNPSSTDEYRHLLAAMAIDRHVIAFDTPGYGMSAAPSAPLSIEGYAAAFHDGLVAMGMAGVRVDLFGFHTGTLLAVELARALGDDAGRLALAGIPYRTPEERRVRLDQIHAVPGPTDDGGAIFDRLRWLWDFVVAQRHADLPIVRAAAIFAERAKPLHRYWWAYEGVWTYPIEARLAAVRVPTLVLLPDELLHAQSIAAAALIPGATTQALPALTRDIFEPEGGCAIVAAALRAFFA
jgi:pimeloyl-ACP methyl ester carboxylesterase